ncbi:phage baseplate assembly protein [Kozakia baliensis]|uniref:Uncharacterized protein n=1 Tax=Kozakia baliensis TaxID=153496 RepID=A0A1D8UTX3_9PROT|nr:phage tail protein [Kozakia baliensis]AOX16917.1 hypothetical protein A0U89_06960 [Kozakia baliensis]GBR25602.1 bacteriophage tail protein GpP Mu-like [Kozakia baliensis NRIC 0488]GEL64036.1 tail protein [Kozakia baliensis]
MSIVSSLRDALGIKLPEIDTDISLTVGGIEWRGWQEIRITRGCERCPGDFDIGVTEKFSDATQIDVQPGQTCVLKAGKQPLITGYIDLYGGEYDAINHGVRIGGRSKCQDLVDTHAIVPNGQLGNCTIRTLAEQLAAPYGIVVDSSSVTLPVDPQESVLPVFNVTLGMTPFEIIEVNCRYYALLVYDGPDGNLVLSPVSTQKHASGFSEGVNVQGAGVSFRMDERMSTYYPVLFSAQTMNDFAGGNVGNQFTPLKDPGVPRYRPFFVVSEQYYNDKSLAQQRAAWELQRRRGRSQVVRLVVDSWYDSAGQIWQPNRLAPVNLPTLKLPNKTWLITEVTLFSGEARGTGAEITLMPPEAMTVEPAFPMAFDYQVAQALAQGQTP